MKNIFGLLLMAAFVLSLVPGVLAVSTGVGIGVDVDTEDFVPMVWMCDNRVVYDDNTEPGRLFAVDGSNSCGGNDNGDGDDEDDCELLERQNNYAFEGEQVTWDVFVLDKNKIDQNIDVYGTVGDVQGEGNPIEVNCFRNDDVDLDSCNARILEEDINELAAINDGIADTFTCILTVETPNSMQGEYWLTVEAQDGDGNLGTMKENEYWFLNPEIGIAIEGDLAFENVRPGSYSYSETLLVENDAEAGSGVLLDMFISGTDFYDSSSSGARCPSTNQLSLSAFRYFATNGAYSSFSDADVDVVDGDRDTDVEGYTNIDYGLGFNDPSPFYDNMEILQGADIPGPYYAGNFLAPGAEMALTFRLDLPEPCNGDFDTGAIYFFGEAI